MFKGMKFKKVNPFDVFAYAFLTVFGFVNIWPVLYAFFGSLSTNENVLNSVFLPKITDFSKALAGFGEIFKDGDLIRSVAVTSLRILLHTVMGVSTSLIAGFVFARREFPGKNALFMVFMITTMIPGVALTVPAYVFDSKFPLVGGNDILGRGGTGFINNPAMLFVFGWVSVYNIFLCRQNIVSIGGAYEDAAEIDGAGFLGTIFLVYLPMLKPVCAVIFLNTFVGMWGDFMTCYIYLPDAYEWHTIGKKVADLMEFYLNPNLGNGVAYPECFAVSMVALIPPIAVFLSVQKSFVAGMNLGGVKE